MLLAKGLRNFNKFSKSVLRDKAVEIFPCVCLMVIQSAASGASQLKVGKVSIFVL